MNRVLKLSEDKKIFGVCGGLAEFIDIDATIVRFGFFTLCLFYGFGILSYLVLAWIMPDE